MSERVVLVGEADRLQGTTDQLRAQCYNVPVKPGLTEHEFNHVFASAVNDAAIDPGPAEVAGWTWTALPALRDDPAVRPDRYAP